MSYTKDYEAVENDWTLVIALQTGGGFVQLKDEGPVLVAVSPLAPAADSVEGILLCEGKIEAVSFSSLEGTDNVWVRSIHEESNTVVAQAAGTAPAPA